MILHLTQEEAAIRAVVGSETFLRGRRYALSGAVGELDCSGDGRVVRARVTGTVRQPYVVTDILLRDTDGSVSGFVGSCTCPVGNNCKHTVAVALRAVGIAPEPDAAPAVDPSLAGWEATLEALTRRTDTDADTAVATDALAAQVALQFDVTSSPATGGPASVLLRPVVPGRTGWVRSGISWSNLHPLRYTGHPGAAEHERLLTELVTLHGAARTPHQHYYGYREQRITLESFTSRRVWDLLDELRAAGMPFVQAGRSAAAVLAHTGVASPGFDLTAGTAGVTIAARVLLDGTARAVPDGLLLGEPVHGLAWVEGGVLNLARLSVPAGVDLSTLLAAPEVTVPESDRQRLIGDYIPRLRRLVPVVSCDESVVLPDPQPPTLTLHVEHRDGHELGLAWGWRYTDGATPRTEPFRPDVAADPLARDAALEQQIARPALDAARALPALLDDGQLAPARVLGGLSTADFVREVLPELAGLDGVDVTVTGEPADYRESHEAPVITFAGEPEGHDWYDLAVTVSVAGRDVPFVEIFQALAQDEEYLLLPDGLYFALDRPEFAQLAQLIDESRELLDAPSGVLRVGRLQAGVWDEIESLGIVGAQADTWRGAARALSAVERIAEQPVPSGLQAQLRSYQLDGFNWLAFLFEHGLGGVLADEMGLGKTIQVLALICHAQEKGLTDSPFLVVAPTSVVHNWASESARFAPNLTVRTITETRPRRGHDLAALAHGADVIVTSYTLFRLEHDDYAALPWAGLILDEAQFVKNHQSLAYRCAKTLDTAFKLAVTGTPLENTMMELWSLLSITAAGLFPKPRPFEQYYRTPIERGQDADRLELLRRRVRPLMLRRTKKQVLADLPDKQEQLLELDLNPRHRRIYQTHLQRERQKVLGLIGDLEENRFAIFRSLTLLRQACLSPGLVDPAHATVPSTKLDALLDHLTELAADGHRAVVFSQFTRFLDAARARLDAAGIEYCYLDGRTKRRAEVVERFKSGAAPVFLVSLKAGGFGLTLTEADYCFLLDPWWNPATEAQAVDRLHRIGQVRKVMVYRMVARETIEEKVMALKASKAALFDSIMDARGVTSGKLTAADIRGLVE